MAVVSQEISSETDIQRKDWKSFNEPSNMSRKGEFVSEDFWQENRKVTIACSSGTKISSTQRM